MIPSLLIRRLFFVPSQINFIYFDFANQNGFVYWSNSFMKYFINYPYGNTPLTHVIAAFDGYPNAGYNTGFLPSGYLQAGYIGIVLYTFIFTIIMNIINNFAKKIDNFLINSLTIIPILDVFKSSDLFTSLLTHGILLIILNLWLYKNKKVKLNFNKGIYSI